MAENPNVLLDTTEGEILIELYPDKAPETVESQGSVSRDGGRKTESRARHFAYILSSSS